MMLLMVIFMITAPIMQGGVDVKLPTAEAKPLDPKGGMVVTVNKQGQIFVDESRDELRGVPRVVQGARRHARQRRAYICARMKGANYGVGRARAVGDASGRRRRHRTRRGANGGEVVYRASEHRAIGRTARRLGVATRVGHCGSDFRAAFGAEGAAAGLQGESRRSTRGRARDRRSDEGAHARAATDRRQRHRHARRRIRATCRRRRRRSDAQETSATRDADAATKTPPKEVPQPKAGGGPTGGAGTDVANMKTEGVEFTDQAYLNNIVRQIAVRFKPRNPGALRAEVFFIVRRDGSVGEFKFLTQARTCTHSISRRRALSRLQGPAKAFGSLPPSYVNDFLPVIFSFDPSLIR